MTIPAFLRKSPKVRRLDNLTRDYQPLLGTWLIKMALMFEWYRPPRKSRWPNIFDCDGFMHLTGITFSKDSTPSHGENDDVEDIDEARGKPGLLKCRQLIENRLITLKERKIPSNLTLFRNVELLSKLLDLTEADKVLLTFGAAIKLFPDFCDAICANCEKVSLQIFSEMLARLTGISESRFLTALGEEGVLVTSGLIRVKRSVTEIEDKIDMISGLPDMLLTPHKSVDAMIERFLKKSSPSSLKLDNFPHLAGDSAILREYLKNALDSGTTGVNILLHGKPGVGKTEYVQALAAELGIDLYEIAFTDENGGPIKGEARLRAYNLCQRMLARTSNALLMFDEIEDVFPCDMAQLFALLFGGGEEASGGLSAGKAWINRTMERNRIPAIWVSNRINQIDPAYKRRFDYSIGFPLPPKAVRYSIANHHLGCFDPPEAMLERIASNEEITPGQLDRAAKVARIASKGDKLRAIELIDQTLERSSLLLGQKFAPVRNIVRTAYHLSLLNTDADIPAIVSGLKRRPRGSFCFYGVAGTGKSELARHIADQIGKPLLMRRASDILDKYVGESEKRIAGMFAEARQQDAVLVLDEADSFLADRRDALHSWEVTQVNELLTQMEAHEGIFICTTNLMEKLDPASLRRFAFKVKFEALTPDQRWTMFRNELVRLGGVESETGTFEKKVRGLDRLTPGDFAVAARQFELWDIVATPDKLYELLRKECEAKGAVLRKIGFGAGA